MNITVLRDSEEENRESEESRDSEEGRRKQVSLNSLRSRQTHDNTRQHNIVLPNTPCMNTYYKNTPNDAIDPMSMLSIVRHYT